MNTVFENIQYNDLHTDYKAETVALNLMRFYQDIEQIFFNRLGNNGRPFHKDVKAITGTLQHSEEKTVYIDSFRESIYNYLPEGIFHHPSLGSYHTGSGISNVVFQIQKQKEVENSARKFFHLFEMETWYLELSALLVESEYDFVSNSNLLIEIVKDLWPLLSALDTHTARVFIYMLPFFHAARGNKWWLEKCLKAFLQLPVSISFVPHKIEDIAETSDSLVLSNIRLGISSVLIGSHFDGERNWAIHIGPIPYSDLKHFMPLSNYRKLLALIYNYCIPVTVQIEEYFITNKTENSFTLGKNNDTGILGYATFL
ncbi:MAG: type VI secretion system baseplate subunit TssG [Chitinophagaceae bacterium]|jgi:hypothetical protein|nr:type VI secretion system baseplate subunit TssG [Chitinophagaceae bacterium]